MKKNIQTLENQLKKMEIKNEQIFIDRPKINNTIEYNGYCAKRQAIEQVIMHLEEAIRALKDLQYLEEF